MSVVLITLFVLGLLACVVGSIWLLVCAFRESIWWGLGTLIISPVGLIFTIVHWATAKRPFLTQLAGGLVVLGAGLALLNQQAPAFAKLLGEQAFAQLQQAAGKARAQTATDPYEELRRLEAQLLARKKTLDSTNAEAVAQLRAEVLAYNNQLQKVNALVAAGPPSRLAGELAGSLVAMQGGALAPFEDVRLRPVKFYALYFSAEWCPPCRAFTPELVRWYQQTRPAHPEFELIFLSRDRSAQEMINYIAKDAMPWPAVAFDQRASSPLERYAGSGIPCLVFVDADGKVLADSYVNGHYRGPRPVLQEMTKLLGSPSGALAQRR